MPSEKRTRQRAARAAKLEELARQRKRRQTRNRAISAVVVVVLLIGGYLVFFSSSTSSPKKSATASTTTSTTSTTVASTTTSAANKVSPAPKGTVTVASSDTQSAVNAVAVEAGCPSSTTTPANDDHWSAPPPMTIDQSKTYTADIQTDVGTITVTLDAKNNPEEVNNFVFLADQGYYDCVIFPRVIPSFMNQTGSPSQSNSGSFGYTVQGSVPATATNAADQYPLGALACAKTSAAPNGTCSDQFFIITGSEGESLQPQYSLFGTVTSGMSVAQEINGDGDPNSNSDGTGTSLKITHRMLRVTISSS